MANHDPAYTVQHRTGKGIGHPVQPKEFKANILCKDHNTALHPADDAALAFATFLRRTALQHDAGAGEWVKLKGIARAGPHLEQSSVIRPVSANGSS